MTTLQDTRNALGIPDTIFVLEDSGKHLVCGTFPCTIQDSPQGRRRPAWAAVNLDTNEVVSVFDVMDGRHKFINPYTGESFVDILDCVNDVRFDPCLSLGLVELTDNEEA